MRVNANPVHPPQPVTAHHPGTDDAAGAGPTISYTPEQYGTWDSFTCHPDYEQAKQQYARIFADIDTLISQHAWHPGPQQAAFVGFLAKVHGGRFISREQLLYGEGKRLFDTFHTLVIEEALPLEKRLTAIRNLSQEIQACADGAINSLISIIRQLQLTGSHDEVQQIKEQLVEQLILAFHRQKLEAQGEEDNPSMEKHAIAVYHNFLRARYDLPSLAQDILARPASQGINDEDLNACAEYVAAHLTPMRIVTLLTENYLAEVQAALPAQGLTWHEAKDALDALNTRFAPLYGEISEALVLEEKGGRYHATTRPVLLKLALLKLLQPLIGTPVVIQVSCYTLPDRIIRLDVHDPVTGARREEKRRLAGEVKSIYMAEGEFWLSSDQDPTLQFVTLADLSDLFTHRPPYLSVLTPEHIPALMLEAVRNSTDEELAQTLAAHPRIPPLLSAYLQAKVANADVETLVKLLSGHDITDMDRFRQAMTAILRELNYTGLVKQEWDTLQMVEALYRLLSQAYTTHMDSSEQLSETFFLNLCTGQLPLAEKLTFFSQPLITVAAQKGWLSLVEHLCRQPDIDLNVTNTAGQTALMLAAERGHLAIIQTLLAAGADITWCSPKKGNALCHAVIAGHIPVFRYLLNLYGETEINTHDANGMTPLLYLFNRSHPLDTRQDMLNTLLNHGADVRIRNSDGHTVLAMKYAFEDEDCYPILLGAGAEIAGDDYIHILRNIVRTLADETIATVLIQKILAQREHTPHFPDDSANTFLFELTRFDRGIDLYAPLLLPHLQQGLTHPSRVLRLMDMTRPVYTADYAEAAISRFVQDLLPPHWIRQPDAEGVYFMEALRDEIEDEVFAIIHEGHDNTLPQLFTLLTRHVDMTLPMPLGDTLLTYLVKSVDHYISTGDMPADYLYPIIRYLATHTSLLSRPDEDGFTPFMWAMNLLHADTIALLLQIDPTLAHNRDPDGYTPMDIAFRHDRTDIVALLAQSRSTTENQ